MHEKSGLEKNGLNVLIGGEAGQGLVTVGELLSRSLVHAGYYIAVTQDYMSRIRGGHNTFAIRAGVTPVGAPQETIDLLVALNAETAALHEKELSPAGLIVGDETFETHTTAPVLKVPFETLADKTLVNVAALGVAGFLLNLDEASLRDAVDVYFETKNADIVGENRRALANAYAWASAHAPPFPRLAPAVPSERKLLLTGNDAIAMGAFSAGVKFCSFYPMSPSTSILLTLIKHAVKMGVVIEQAEDEIAAINMALGASFAGAPSLVATSGGGFALMAEGVSLAAMTETPVVIVVAQRPGPATGLPTRTEQGDLNFVLHAGHGEFPRAILAPGSAEECFDLTRTAFMLAEQSQGPVFVLTDQFLADSFRNIAPFNVPALPGVERDHNPKIAAPYQRYALTETGVSPRLLPGFGTELVVADSDEHTEDGHITEDLDVRRKMVEKRLRKYDVLNAAVVPPLYGGDHNPAILLVSWGSTFGSVVEAREILQKNGILAGNLHFPQVWPLVPERFMPWLEAAGKVVMVESNATGQFAGIIRQQTGVAITNRVLRYDGLSITPRFILESLKAQKLIPATELLP